jgi:beta-alanine degradation protein BauB
MDADRKAIHHGGTEARRVILAVATVAVFCGAVFALQKGQNKDSAEIKPQVVPIAEEHHHHLVLENEYVRVFHVEVAPHSETLYHQHDMDYVFVTLGDSAVESVRVGGKPVKLELKDGDTRFTKGGFAHKAVNLGDKPFVNVTVELKTVSAKEEGAATCGGPACIGILLVSRNIRCMEVSSQKPGIVANIKLNSKHLIVALSDFDINDGEKVKYGDVKWVEGPLKLGSDTTTVAAMYCEMIP